MFDFFLKIFFYFCYWSEGGGILVEFLCGCGGFFLYSIVLGGFNSIKNFYLLMVVVSLDLLLMFFNNFEGVSKEVLIVVLCFCIGDFLLKILVGESWNFFFLLMVMFWEESSFLCWFSVFVICLFVLGGFVVVVLYYVSFDVLVGDLLVVVGVFVGWVYGSGCYGVESEDKFFLVMYVGWLWVMLWDVCKVSW